MRSRLLGTSACYVAALAPHLAQGAAHTVDDKFCGKACRQTFKTLRFSDVPAGLAPPFQECSSRLYQQGLYLCWGMRCSTEVRLLESRSMNRTCKDLIGSYLPQYSIVDNFTDEDISRLVRFNATYPDHNQLFNQPMLPSQDFYDLWGRTLDAVDYVHYYHYYYGWAMGIFWAWVVLMGIANRVLIGTRIWSARSFSGQNRMLLWLKRTTLTPATFGQRCVQDLGGWGTLPPRVQTLTLLLFVFINVAFSVHGYRIFEGNMYYPSKSMQILRHVSDRTGIISFANFPLIWLFGMRNNLLIWLTGWNFGTYNNFHRWLARIATVQAIVHSLGYSALILRKGGWEYFWRLWALTFWWTGELATVFMSLLVVFSVFWVRRRQYEVFLVVHIVLSILILVTMLGHVWIFKGVYDALVWVPAVIWLLDRVLRGARIIAFNPVFWDTHASVTYNEQAHMIRLVVPLSSNFYQVKPGTFCYIMVLNKWDFWESHPFTVASVSGNNRSAAQPQEHAPLLRSEPLSLDDMGIEPKRRAEEMTFLIRPYDSFTSRLKEHAESSYPKPATLRVAIDGPYGRTAPLERFDKVLFVVGGSGIAVPLSYLETLIASSKRPKAIYIHWAVQQSALAIDVLHCELNEALKSNRVRVNVYVTRSQGRVSSDETTCRFVEWRTGRMSTEGVIQATLSTEETDSLAVVACGPARMADDCRRIVATKMVHSLPYIEYFEESFQW